MWAPLISKVQNNGENSKKKKKILALLKLSNSFHQVQRDIKKVEQNAEQDEQLLKPRCYQPKVNIRTPNLVYCFFLFSVFPTTLFCYRQALHQPHKVQKQQVQHYYEVATTYTPTLLAHNKHHSRGLEWHNGSNLPLC